MRRTWVAQAGESAETVSSPASKDSGFDVHPVAEDGAYRGPFPPAARRQEAADGRGERLWIVPSWPRRPGQGRCGCLSQAPSFRILGLLLLALRGPRAVSPGPGVGSGPCQGLGG
jgi:hypothetical protein